MSKTQETFDKMPANVRFRLDCLRRDYKNPALNRDAVRKEAYGFTLGLHYAGLITESERATLFIYTTV